ncbi:MAG: UPF0280 family protein [Actinomycetota bacterium]
MVKPGINIEPLTDNKFEYRKKIGSNTAYKWHIVFRHSDLYVASNKNIIDSLVKYLTEFYQAIEEVIAANPSFRKSICPVKQNPSYPSIINEMIKKSAIFGVGPMASVAGAVCDFAGRKLISQCSTIIIENGGDIFIKSDHDIVAGIYAEGRGISDKLKLKIDHRDTPCGLCSSSGVLGHSLSLGKSDLASVMATTAIAADAAATSMANRISAAGDIQAAIDEFRKKPGIRGLLAIKDKKIGLWGRMELAG